MKSKKIIFGLFALIILIVPAYIIFGSERVLENGHLHKIKLRGYDPFDPFRGKYLRLNFEDFISCDESLQAGDKAFVLLKKDSLGFSYFASAEDTRPDHDDYIEAELLYADGGMAQIKIDNLTKYFINEHKATQAENLVMEYTREKPNQIYAAVRVLDGEARLDDIYLDEKPLKEILN